jgi:hypothetical protein
VKKAFCLLLLVGGATSAALADNGKQVAALKASSLVDYRECALALQSGRAVRVASLEVNGTSVQNGFFINDELFVVSFVLPDNESKGGVFCQKFYLKGE